MTTLHEGVQLLRSAGLTPQHLHRLLGVATPTVARWYRGQGNTKWKPNHFDDLVSAVANAIEDGKLPVDTTGLRKLEALAVTFVTASRYFRQYAGEVAARTD